VSRWSALRFAALLVVAGGCSPDDLTSGPCVHTYEDALFHIESVVDADSLTPIDTIVISEAMRDTISHPPSRLTLEYSDGIEVRGDTIVCEVPCSFGTYEGSWTFRVSAAGYPSQWLSVNAQYAVFHGGCPSYNDSGMTINWKLDP
jgi:hypothetical protein